MMVLIDVSAVIQVTSLSQLMPQSQDVPIRVRATTPALAERTTLTNPGKVPSESGISQTGDPHA